MPGRRLALVCAVVGVAMALGAGRAGATGTGAGLFVAGKPVPMVDAAIDVEVRMGVAHGVVRQRFHNQRPEAIEAVYVFPLPTGATVEAMDATLGDVTIHGTIARRADASARYQAAVEDGDAAALTEAERPGVFTQSIAPVPAGGDVEITLRWRAPLTRRDGVWELAHPLVVGPRYVPGQATGAPTVGGGTQPDTDRAPDASRITPPTTPGAATPYQLTVTLDDAGTVSSPTHPIAVEPQGAGARVTLADARGDRELVLRWGAGPAAQVRALAEPDGHGGAYVAVLIEAERATVAPARAARRWILAIDRSPSVDGAAAAAARGVASSLIAALGPDEQVAVVAIGDRPRFAADRAAAARAVAELPVGGDDLTRGLAATLANLPRDPAPEVVLITDGLVADDAAAIERAVAAGVHVHAVGVGGAPNRWLLNAIAARTSATVNVVSSIDDADAIARSIVAADRASPVTVDWRSPAVTDAEATSPQLAPGGATLLIAVDPTGVPRGEVVVAVGSRKLRAKIAAASGGDTLAATWAALRVQRLYGAGDREGATRLALARGVIAPTTALVAVVASGGDPVRSTITVPLPIPVGTRRNGVLAEQRDGARDEADEDLARHDADNDTRDGRKRPQAPAQPTVDTGTTAAPVPAGGATLDDEYSGDFGGGEGEATEATAPSDAPASRSFESLAGADASVLGGRAGNYRLIASLNLGARLDERVPAGLASFGLYRVLPRFFWAGLRLDLTGAPTADTPFTAAGLFSFSSSGRGLLRLDGGAGLGWDGGLAAAYQVGLFAGQHGVGVSLRLSGFAGPADRTSSTLGVGVEASF